MKYVFSNSIRSDLFGSPSKTIKKGKKKWRKIACQRIWQTMQSNNETVVLICSM